jgi:uncharacterized alkaline shock family protein YloU
VLIGVILFAVLLAASLFVLSRVFEGEAAWSAFIDLLREGRILVAAGSLALALLLVLYALTGFKLPEKRHYIAYDIEGGAVSISLRAVQDFLARLTGEFAAIEDLKPSLSVHNGAVDVQLDVKVRAGARIPELCRMLQDRARATLRDHVGLSEIKEVRVRVQEIVGDAPAETSAGDRPETFTA